MGIVKRSDKKAFYGIQNGDSVTYGRMQGFTQIAKSMNPVEYSRKYVDMDFEESDVVGYAPSIALSFDEHSGNAVHADIKAIFDGEKTGDDAVREIVVVDFTQPVSGTEGAYAAKKRKYALIPADEGSGSENYSYTASLKVKGETVSGTAVSSDNWQTLTFTASDE